MSLLEVRPEGLYCKPGNFYIDAWSPVKTCIVTHAHGDHARWGHQHYISTENTAEILLLRLGPDCPLEKLDYERKVKINECWVSLHPAGHILGSSQIRIETKDTVCVVSGDYKRAEDISCEPFQILECDIFVTESTFGLPIYHWENPENTIGQIIDWWAENQQKGFASILFCYALGKAQRILSMLNDKITKPVYVHGAILNLAKLYQKQGVSLAEFLPISEHPKKSFSRELILAPPSAKGSPWMKRFFPYKTASASGWMQVRGTRRRKNFDQGFVLSDHADWNDLLRTIQETKATTILTTHGNATSLARYLRWKNINAYSLSGTELMEEGEA